MEAGKQEKIDRKAGRNDYIQIYERKCNRD